jgi:integration host factor subunit beta
LIQRLAEQNPHMLAKDIEKAVTAILHAIATTLARRDRVELRGIGAFGVNTRSARPGRNPKTGQGLNVPEKRHPYFKMTKQMHKRLNPATCTAPATQEDG